MMFLGVYREKMFSRGRVEDDALILEETLRELASRGHAIGTCTGESLDGEGTGADCVLTMAESKSALATLARWQKDGTRIVNGVRQVKNCLRTALFRLLTDAGLSVPEGEIVPVEHARGLVSFRRFSEYWLKRGDVHSINPGDVVKVSTPDGAQAALDHFMRTGIEQVLVQEHVHGESIKFYAVTGARFFKAFRPGPEREEVTDRVGPLRDMAERAGQATGLEVFGGDAVIAPDGRLFLVDLNDWPSFAACRRMAAQKIAAYVEENLG